MRRILRHVLGWVCIVVGIAGLFLPIIQGLLLIGIGSLLLAPDIPFFHRIVVFVETKVPGIRAIHAKWHARFGHDRGQPDKKGD